MRQEGTPESAGESDLENRFEMIRQLKGGAQAETCLARHRTSQRLVVLKRLRLDAARDWKTVELFEREARVLAALAHPSIPAYQGGCVLEGPGESVSLVLIQDYVEGQTLHELVEREVMDEQQARKIARDVLEVLAFLQRQTPPVIHRDIKPSNLIRRPDGGISLIDFGAVQALRREGNDVGSTIVGTPGFVAPEQMMGRAVPASDLYGLGATLVQLLTGCSPSELPSNGLRIDYLRDANVSVPFGRFVQRLLAPSLDERFRDAAQALASLSTLPTSIAPSPGTVHVSPAWSPNFLRVTNPQRVVTYAGLAACLLLAVLWVTGVLELEMARGGLHVDARFSSGEQVPDVRVFVDDELECVAVPCTKEAMRTGSHQVRVEARGHPTRTRDVLVEKGKTANLYLGY